MSLDPAQNQSSLETIPRLLEALRHPCAAGRTVAADRLCALGEVGFKALQYAALSGEGWQRTTAVIRLGDMGDPRAVETLLAVLRNERRRQTVGKRRGALKGLLEISLWILVSMLMAFPILPNDLLSTSDAQSNLRFEIDLRVKTLQALGKLGSSHALVPLIQILHADSEDKEVREAARAALLRLLTDLSAGSPEQTHALDDAVIPALERLARSAKQAAVRDEWDLRVKARELLAVLRKRAAREQQRTTLLRGAGQANGVPGSGELLRPACGSPASAAPEQLLRAASPFIDPSNDPPTDPRKQHP